MRVLRPAQDERVSQIESRVLSYSSEAEEAVHLQFLIVGGFCLFSGIQMLIFPRKKRLAAEAKIRSRKQELAAGAPERYFEEGRSIDAYPLPPTDSRWRIKGAFLTVCGVALWLLDYFR